MFKEDKEIKNSDDDTLNREDFAKNLALNIENFFNRKDIDKSLTIGLMGEWGSGKTSLLNMTENHLKKTNIKIIKFNPWLYSSYNQLVEQFFDELIMEFTDSRDETLRSYLRQYKLKMNKLNLSKNLAIAGASLLDSRLGAATERIIKTPSEEKNLEYIKKKLNQQFTNRKVVCIIDDLDRLSKKEIMEMFKLIKIMADFNNIIYLVAFDKEVIAKSLEENYGDKYIEKIINIPLYVPLTTKEELTEIILNEVKRLSEQYQIQIEDKRLNYFLNNDYPFKTKEYGLITFFKNIRDIKRFINILEFNLELIKDEVNFVDFFVITAIQVFNLDMYNKIKYNEFLLTDHHYYDGFTFYKEDVIESKINEFENLCDDGNMSVILKKLFPMMSFIYKPNNYNYTFKELDEKMRICHPNHFKSYFKLNDCFKEITEKEINEIIDMINSEKPENIILNHLKQKSNKKLELFFESMVNRLDRIEKIEYFIDIIFLIDSQLDKNIYSRNELNIKTIIINLLYKIDIDKRFSCLKENYKKSNNINLLYALIYTIEQDNRNIYAIDEKLLNPTDIITLKDIIERKINKRTDEELKNDLNMSLEIIKICKDLKFDDVKNHVVNILITTPEGIINVLKLFFKEDENDNSALSSIKNLNYYIDVHTIKNKIDELSQDYKTQYPIKIFLDAYQKFNEKITD
jgi:predicted KAP-like P-loop ATPase